MSLVSADRTTTALARFRQPCGWGPDPVVDLKGFSRFGAALGQAPLRDRPALVGRAIGGRARAVALSATYRSGAYRRTPSRIRGKGVILLFHEVHEDVGRELMMGCELRHVLNAVRFCREDGRDLVDLDEAHRRLQDPEARPFAVLTFDDGYRDIRLRVLPALAREGVPFTVFVPSAAISRELYAWWLGLRKLFQENDRVRVGAMEREFTSASHA